MSQPEKNVDVTASGLDGVSIPGLIRKFDERSKAKANAICAVQKKLYANTDLMRICLVGQAYKSEIGLSFVND